MQRLHLRNVWKADTFKHTNVQGSTRPTAKHRTAGVAGLIGSNKRRVGRAGPKSVRADGPGMRCVLHNTRFQLVPLNVQVFTSPAFPLPPSPCVRLPPECPARPCVVAAMAKGQQTGVTPESSVMEVLVQCHIQRCAEKC